MTGVLIDFYRAIEASSLRMLEAAKAQDWEGVMRCEGACAVLIEQLRHRAKTEELGPLERVEKTRIMQRILRNDAQIRNLAEPWLAQLDEYPESTPAFLH
ncbi:flagellar protein FliT [Curvibacter sp. CHRR-16]|uniref:flagellar protein FliT n=1 Tax=Curvibacter sp. CHRR-16 TaxID=2835872 RepID=UPI001BD926E0|nr:flagellar protein FliT [Curvibacter sp. CHRR-16]MBT0569526.1 flagellar protein FliT [Curvibacter sp. CHRR-16]